jgi:hypothetical protein
MNYFCQLLTVQRIQGIRQTEIQTAEPFVLECIISEVCYWKLEKVYVPGVDQSSAELIQAVGGNIAF